MKNKEFTVESFKKLFEDEFWQNHFKKYPENLKIFEDAEKKFFQSEEESSKTRKLFPEERKQFKKQDKIS